MGLERGIPSRRESSAHADYVPALCTHRPSHLPIERFGEDFGLEAQAQGKLFEPHRLEEGEVVTRFPLGNQRKDYYRRFFWSSRVVVGPKF